MKKYNVFTREGRILAENLTSRETIRKLLTHHGHKYRLVQHHTGDCDLYVTTAASGEGRKKKWAAYGGKTKDDVAKKILELGGVYGTYAKEIEQ